MAGAVIQNLVSTYGGCKLTEEVGELLTEIGKFIPFPNCEHPDGRGHTGQRFQRELADAAAAIHFFAMANLTEEQLNYYQSRRDEKLEMFQQWQEDEGMQPLV